MQITTIGLDIAKNVFQVHGMDAAEKVIVRERLRRGQVLAFFKALPPCLIGMEACATALSGAGVDRTTLPPPGQIREAVQRPTMRLVQLKSVEQHGQLMRHRARDPVMRAPR